MECGKCHILLLLGWTHYLVALKRFKALNITQASVRHKIVTNVECTLLTSNVLKLSKKQDEDFKAPSVRELNKRDLRERED